MTRASTAADAAVLVDAAEVPAGAVVGDEKVRFEWGSVTKVFTALLWWRAVQAGELSEDDCALRLLGMTAERRLPLSELAAHASGLPEWPANFSPQPDSLFAHYTATELFAALGRDAAVRTGGGRYAYSSYGMAVLGAAVSRRLGLGYAEAGARFVLRPAGMASAGFDDGAEGTCFGCFAPAGGLVASAADLRQWLRFALFPPDPSWAQCWERIEAVQLSTPVPGVSMACGWHVRETSGGVLHWHNGRTPRGRAFVAFSRARGRGVALATRSDRALDELGFALLTGTEG